MGVVGLAALAFHLWLAVQPPLSSTCSSSGWRVPPASNAAADTSSEASSSPYLTVYAGLNSQLAAGRQQLVQLEGGDAAAEPSSSGKLGSSVAAPAWRWRQRRRALALYLLPRLVVLGYFAGWLAALPLSGAFSLHLHHYALGWAAACFAAFNHPVSGLLLAFGTAVFVQVGSSWLGVILGAACG